jgi:MFS family permease
MSTTTAASASADPALARLLHRLVWPLSAAQLVSWGAIYYSFSLLLEPMETELGWTKADMTGALSLGLAMQAACAIPAGRWIDHRGGRGLMTSLFVCVAFWGAAWVIAGSFAKERQAE